MPVLYKSLAAYFTVLSQFLAYNFWLMGIIIVLWTCVPGINPLGG